MERDAAKFECNQRFRCDPLWFLCRSTQIPTLTRHFRPPPTRRRSGLMARAAQCPRDVPDKLGSLPQIQAKSVRRPGVRCVPGMSAARWRGGGTPADRALPVQPGQRHDRHHIAVTALARLGQRGNLGEGKRLPFPARPAAGRVPYCRRDVVLHAAIGHREGQDGPQRGQRTGRGGRRQAAGFEGADPARYLRGCDRRHRPVAETGLDVIPPGSCWITSSLRDRSMPRGIIALVFRCKITGGHLTANDEVTAFHWADQTDIRQLSSEAYAVRLLDALREGAAPAIREHDGTEQLGRGPPSTALLHYCTTALLCYCACAGLRPLCARSALPNFAVFRSRAVPLRGKAGPASAPGSAVERPARRTPGRSLRDSHQISAAHTPHQQVRSSDCWPPPTSRSSL